MGMKSKIALMNMLTMGAILNSEENRELLAYEERERAKRAKNPVEGYQVVNKGTHEYFFNSQGQFSRSHMRRDELVFKCIASNPKNAIRKFCKQFNVKPDDCYEI